MPRPFFLVALALTLACAALLGLRAPAPSAVPIRTQILQNDPEELLPYLSAPALNSEGAAAFQRATSHVRSGNFTMAEQAYAEFARQNPVLADWAHALAADAAARRGDTAAVRRHHEEGSPWLAREWGWRARVRALRLAGSPHQAVQLAAELQEQLQLPAGRVQAKQAIAELLLMARDTAAARDTLRVLLAQSVDAALLRSSAELLNRLSTRPADQLLCARVLLSAGDLSTVGKRLPKLVARAELAGAPRAQLRLDLANLHFAARRYPAAEKVASALAQDSTEPAELRAAARVLLGRSLLRRGQQTSAVRQFERALGDAAPEVSAQAAFALGDLKHDEARHEDAAHYYRLAVQAAPSSEAGGEAVMRLGADAFARSRYDSAQHWFEQARLATGESSVRALYWLSRTRMALGDSSAALLRQLIERDPISYYAWRAAQQLQNDAAPALAEGPARDSLLSQQMQRAFSRWELLQRADLNDVAAFELARLRRSFAGTPEGLYDLAELMHQQRRTQNAISIGRELQRLRGGWDQRLLRIVYPLPFEDIIESEAAARSVDPYLAAALIRQESGFNPRATSPAGARGLMQIMPRTGRKIARTVKARNYASARLYDPALNVQLGMQHLKELLEAYNNRLPHVLVAYNAGPHRLTKWRAFPEAVDDDLFTERIPFSETRDYVRIVQQNAFIYRTLYGAR